MCHVNDLHIIIIITSVLGTNIFKINKTYQHDLKKNRTYSLKTKELIFYSV